MTAGDAACGCRPRRAARRWTPALPGTLLVAMLLAGTPPAAAAASEEARMLLEEIEASMRATVRYTGIGTLSPRVAAALEAAPRERFVDADQAPAAYVNSPLPIGHGQTISQPFVVALMTEQLDVEPDHRVLEIGTGSGWQAAVLASLVAEVYTIEIVEPLARQARRRLDELGYDNVHVRLGDGHAGWPEAAPFDRIIVTAVADELPPRLVDQLAPGGRMVIPVGPEFGGQNLVVVDKAADGTIETRETLPVRFVEMTGGE
jgi:protein-L-isoaspartate(D-aspartate) O-methyltransferase